MTKNKAMNKPHYYHCATKGFKSSVLFADEREFIAGMNRIAFCVARGRKDFPVIVVAFCLMGNHVHFILYGTRSDCLKWMALFHRLTMTWQANHRSGAAIQESWEIDAWQISDNDDLQEKIAYVFRNPMAAGMAYAPTNYRWSSAGLVFSNQGFPEGSTVGSLSSFKLRNILETKIDLPDDWIILPDGMIWPVCYTDCKLAERAFKQPASFMFMLNQRMEAKVNEEMNRKSLSLPDQDVIRMALEAAREQYDVSEIEVLDMNQRVVLCSMLLKRSGVNIKQLGRIFHISEQDLKRLFE